MRNGKEETNLKLKKGESVRFWYGIVIDNGKKTISEKQVKEMAKDFSKSKRTVSKGFVVVLK